MTNLQQEIIIKEIGNCLANFNIQGEKHAALLRGLELTLFPLIEQALEAAYKEGFDEGQRRQAKFRVWYEKGYQDARNRYREREALALEAVRQEREREIMSLRSDLARAIGRMQGLGYPDKYLEKKYPELKEEKKG